MVMKVHKGDYENFDEEELHPDIEINLERMNDASNRKGDVEDWNLYFIITIHNFLTPEQLAWT